MERGREGRRGVPGAGPVSAPRRPRTSGFKDNSACEDGEDVMDDVHNPRLRERPKKDSTSSAVQAMPSGNSGSTSRNKRKRQGSQELQGQARNNLMDELDETTEDTEVGASEDDDDPPPPPIPRRPGKLRPQGKFLDDGIPADIPTVPRKARTAILKRPQESPSPPVGDLCHQSFTVIPRSPAPVSAPCSSLVVSMNPGRRMKSSGSKVRALKAPKVSPPPVASEQEVEVAHALFDLARMLTNQSNSSKLDIIIGMNPEPKANCKSNVEPEAKFEANELASNIEPCPHLPYPSSRSLPISTAVSTHILSPRSSPIASVTSQNSFPPRVVSSVVSAVGALPVPAITITSLPPATAPPAEAPKRKRPRLRTRPDLMGRICEVGLPASSGDISNSCGLSVPSPGLQAEQIFTSCPPQTDGFLVKGEATSTLGSTTPSPILFSEPHSMGLTSRAGMPAIVIPDKKSIAADEEVMKVELTTTPAPLHNLHIQFDRKLAPFGVASPPPPLTREMDQGSNRMAGNQLLNVDLDGSSTQPQTSAQYQTSTSSISPGSERALEVTGNTAKDGLEKCTATLQARSSGQPSWTDRETGKDGEKKTEHEIQWEEDRKFEKGEETGLARGGQRDNVVHRELDGEGDLSRERERSMEKEGVEEQGSEELTNQTPQQRQGMTQKPDARSPKMERTAVGNATSAAVSSFLASVPLIASSVATGVSSCLVTSASIPSWPLGLPSMGYYSSAATANVWPSGALLGGGVCLDDNAPASVQLPNPYSIQARQPQPWKRCASHVYIAHFIDLQQQMNRHPFMHAAYQNSGGLFGAKPYNLNIPIPPGEALFGNGPGGPLLGCMSGVAEVSVIAGDGGGSGLGVLPGSEGNIGVAPLMTSSQSKDRAFGETLSKKQLLQQQQQPPQQQPSPNLVSQSGPGFGFQVSQAGGGGVGGLAAPPPAACGGPTGNPGSGGGSAPVGGNSASATGSNTVTGPGPSNGGVVSHAVAQAQYLQAVMQQGGFSFPFQAAAHFGQTFNGPPGHIGPQQATQFFGSPFYTTHLVHPPAHPQQQVQQGPNLSGGLPSVQKQQHAIQQAARSFPLGSQQQLQQSTSVLVSHSPSQSLQQHTQNTASQQIQHLTERDGSNIGDSNSSSENKFSMLQRNVYGQGNSHVTVSAVNPSSSLVLGGGSQTVTPQDFNILSSLGAKQQQGQLASQLQQPQAGAQHHVGGPAVHTSFKGVDQQPSQTFSAMSIASMNRGAVVGPGPLGLAPVAAVMAPQGHAMLHGVADVSRGHTQHQQSQNLQSITVPSHQHSLQSGQQHRGAVQTQKTASPIISAEDGRTLVDGNLVPSRNGREAAEDRKLPSKRGMSSSNLIRVDLENTPNVQGASSGPGLLHPRITGSGVPTLNLLTPPPAILLSRPVGHPSGSGLQQPGATLAGSQNTKQAPPRAKVLAGLGGVALASATQSQLSFSDKPSLPVKIQGTPVSSSGQNISQSSQVPRHGQISQHTQLKLSNRSSLGSLPTPSGTAPQAVLAAAIAKSQQVPQQQQSRTQAQVGTNAGPSTRLPSSNCGGAPTSTSIPLPPLPPASKSAPTSASKLNLTSKNSFSVSHKPSSGVSGKRASPTNVSHVSSNLGSSPLVQKSFQNQHHSQLPSLQPQQNLSQYQTQPSKLPQQSTQQPSHPSQSLISPQYHQQAHQAHLSSQQQLHQVHNKQVLTQQQQSHQMQRVYLQTPAFQPLQQSPGSDLSPLPQQQSSHQTTAVSQSQQRASSPQQQHSLQGSPGSNPETTSNGSLSLGPPTLTLGTGSNGNTSRARPCSDSLSTSQGPGSRSNSTANKMSVSGASQSTSRSNTGGPSFLPAQFVSNVSSGLQQSGSPRNSPGPQYLQAIMNSEAGTKLAEQKVMTDGNGQEQVNGIRGLSNSLSLMPQMPQSSSPGRQPISAHQLTAGNLVGKSLGVQFAGSNYSEGLGSRSGLLLSVAPPNLSSNSISQSSNPNSNVSNSGGLDSTVHLV